MTDAADWAPLPRRQALARLQDRHPELAMDMDTSNGPPVYHAKGADAAGHQVVYTAGTVESLRSKIEGPLVTFDDASQPSIPRVYDYWLGGKDHFAADRALAARIEAIWPHTQAMVRENRGFLRRAIPFVLSQGIEQIIDLGAGLPTSPAVHEIAREAAPGTRVAYVDNDMMVIRHYQAVRRLAPDLVAVPADLRYWGSVWGRPELTDVIDLGVPMLLIMAFVLHFHDVVMARRGRGRLYPPAAAG